MDNNDRVFKAFRLQKKYVKNLEEIIKKQNEHNEYIKSNYVSNERIVVEEAIDFYHKYVMGTDVVSPNSEKIVDRVGNIVEMQLSAFSKTMANYFNAMLLNEETILNMIPIILEFHEFDFERIAHGDDMGLRNKLLDYKPLIHLLQEVVAEQDNDR
ncbi:hypothetical protein [Erysipelothrix rhusiopathiae]|uniref:hypothetical protein n=1 Tax=Erysipelothrix rhusiopathiae TaxID=1648 RepID=UPI003BF54622